MNEKEESAEYLSNSIGFGDVVTDQEKHFVIVDPPLAPDVKMVNVAPILEDKEKGKLLGSPGGIDVDKLVRTGEEPWSPQQIVEGIANSLPGGLPEGVKASMIEQLEQAEKPRVSI